MKHSRLLPLLGAALIFTSCSSLFPEQYETCACGYVYSHPTVSQPILEDEKEVESTMMDIFENMTLEEKVGQLFLVRPEALDPAFTPEQVENTKEYSVTALSDVMKSTLQQYPVGGVVFFGKNIETPEQLTAFTKDFAAFSGIPLLIGIDEEGGRVARIGNNPNFSVRTFESMEQVSKTGKVRESAKEIGDYLIHYGFHLDFAPVADVNTNPDNIVIGNRAFGSDPEQVAEMVTEAVKGFQDAGIINSIKHFPGHGDTKGDTHNGFVSIEKTWDDLLKAEMLPFVAGIEAGVDMVMVSHITAENICSDGYPASMSQDMITGKLRGELGYQGIVITDSMAMGAIVNTYSSGDAAVQAILAGVDIVLMPEVLSEAFERVLAAVKDGTITSERLDESVLRILTLKEKYQLIS